MDCLELVRSPTQMYYIPLKVAMVYMLNPFTILCCVAKSTCGLNNSVLGLFFLCTIKKNTMLSAIFLALATYQSIYPITLCAPAMLYIMQRLYIPVNYRWASFWWFMVQYLSFTWAVCSLSSASLSFCWAPGTTYHLSMDSYLTPNIGLFWYFFTEMFEHLRLFFLCDFQINVFFYTIPLSIKLKEHPVFLMFMQLAVMSIFKSYPTVGDIALYLSLLPLWSHLHRYFPGVRLLLRLLTERGPPHVWTLPEEEGRVRGHTYFKITLKDLFSHI
ncbi:hypothetical protein NQD34_018337 [Periophthalmus magnuspinnatus]|nr:hypothetical protein NQD34_018337 [Periophthalmus magnuspinnatus]